MSTISRDGRFVSFDAAFGGIGGIDAGAGGVVAEFDAWSGGAAPPPPRVTAAVGPRPRRPGGRQPVSFTLEFPEVADDEPSLAAMFAAAGFESAEPAAPAVAAAAAADADAADGVGAAVCLVSQRYADNRVFLVGAGRDRAAALGWGAGELNPLTDADLRAPGAAGIVPCRAFFPPANAEEGRFIFVCGPAPSVFCRAAFGGDGADGALAAARVL